MNNELRLMNHGKSFLRMFFQCFILYSLFFILATGSVNAAGFSLRISPAILPIDVEPGNQIEKTIFVENLTDTEEQLDISFMPFRQSNDENGQVSYDVNKDEFFQNDPDIFEKVKILDVNQAIQTITLAPKQKKPLVLRIDLPEKEKESDYYFSIVFISKAIVDSQETDEKQLTAKSFIDRAIAANILLSVATGEKKAEGTIESFETLAMRQKGPVDFRIKIKNTGKHKTQVAGSLLIKNMFEQPIANIDIKPTYILENTSRVISASWPETFIVGPYKTYLSIALSGAGPVFGKATYFFGFPAELLIGIILAIILLFFIVHRVKSKVR